MWWLISPKTLQLLKPTKTDASCSILAFEFHCLLSCYALGTTCLPLKVKHSKTRLYLGPGPGCLYSSLGKFQGYHKEAWLLHWDNESWNRSALTDELKLREDNSDPIKVHLELHLVSHRDRVFATEIFPKISSASTSYKWLIRLHLF